MLNDLVISDTMTGASGTIVVPYKDAEGKPINKGVSYDSDVKTFTLTDIALTTNASFTFTYTYEVQDEDAGKTLTNVAVPTDGVTPDDPDKGKTETPVDWKITYHNMEGAVNAASNPDSYQSENGVNSFADPTQNKPGYSFGGWYWDADFTQSVPATGAIPVNTNGNKDLYAKWTEETVTITYKVAAVSPTGSVIKLAGAANETYGSADIAQVIGKMTGKTAAGVDLQGAVAKDITTSGLQFVGWYSADQTVQPENPETNRVTAEFNLPAPGKNAETQEYEDATFYALYKEIPPTITVSKTSDKSGKLVKLDDTITYTVIISVDDSNQGIRWLRPRRINLRLRMPTTWTLHSRMRTGPSR